MPFRSYSKRFLAFSRTSNRSFDLRQIVLVNLSSTQSVYMLDQISVLLLLRTYGSGHLRAMPS